MNAGHFGPARSRSVQREPNMTDMTIRTIVTLGLLAATPAAHAAATSPVITTDDLLSVVGSGANLATIVIDFNDGTSRESFAWGYRFDGEASGADMILAVTAADPALSVVSFGSGASGFFLTEIRYDDGSAVHNATSGSFANFPDDYDSWGYYLSGGFAGGAIGSPDSVAGGGDRLPTGWVSSPAGASAESFGSSGRLLTDGAWDAWSFGPSDASYSHIAPPSGSPLAAVPEPSIVLLGSLLGPLTLLRRRR